jgi:hypothetical protein
MVRAFVVGLGAAFAIFLPIEAQAQADVEGEVTLFSRGRYGGARYVIAGPQQGIRIPFAVRSVQLPEGVDWEFCTGNSFTGCRRLSQSMPAIIMTVRSARPVSASAAAAAVTPGVAPPSPSLRGVASEFFVAPEQGSRRIEVGDGTAGSAARRADEFCRALGWRSSAHEGLQSVHGSSYLADVLCVQSGE